MISRLSQVRWIAWEQSILPNQNFRIFADKKIFVPIPNLLIQPKTKCYTVIWCTVHAIRDF